MPYPRGEGRVGNGRGGCRSRRKPPANSQRRPSDLMRPGLMRGPDGQISRRELPARPALRPRLPSGSGIADPTDPLRLQLLERSGHNSRRREGFAQDKRIAAFKRRLPSLRQRWIAFTQVFRTRTHRRGRKSKTFGAGPTPPVSRAAGPTPWVTDPIPRPEQRTIRPEIRAPC